MKKFQLNTKDIIPATGLGTWKIDKNTVANTVISALEMGYEHIDCAPIYGNETEIGEAISHSLKKKTILREKLWVTSKLWNSYHHPKMVKNACKRTLTDLNVDYLDLYLIHWPIAFKHDVQYPNNITDILPSSEIPLRDTWSEMEKLVEEGLVKNIGVSNFNIDFLKKILTSAKIKPSVNQIESHPYLQQQKLLKFCAENNIHITAYSSLGSSDRPEELKVHDEKPILLNENIVDIAQRLGVSTAQVLLKWQIDRGCSVIPKSINPHRMLENLVSHQIELNSDDRNLINRISYEQRYVNPKAWFENNSPYTESTVWGN